MLVALSELNPAVPPALESIIQKAMALDPQDRYPSANALRIALEPYGTGRRLPSLPAARPVAPASRRIVAGLLDVAATMLVLAALTVGLLLPLQQVLVAGVLLWCITQLLSRVTGATPGMLVMGLRLTDLSGGVPALRAVLFRTVMLVATFITLRLRADTEGLLMHDRVSNTRVVIGTK